MQFGLWGTAIHVEVRYSTQDSLTPQKNNKKKLSVLYKQDHRRHQPLLTCNAGQMTEILKGLGGVKHEAMDTRQPKPLHVLP